MTDRRVSCHLRGSEALRINCADLLLELGHVILGMVSDAPAITAWCTNLGVGAIPATLDYARIPAERSRDHPLSETNLNVAPAALGAPDAPGEGLGRKLLTDLKGK